MARAPVSKTGGWGFETLHPCQVRSWQVRWGSFGISLGSVMRVAMDPVRFVREVRSEAAKVTWPSRKETLVTTGLVVAMATVAAIFFFIIDQIIGVGVRALFGVAG